MSRTDKNPNPHSSAEQKVNANDASRAAPASLALLGRDFAKYETLKAIQKIGEQYQDDESYKELDPKYQRLFCLMVNDPDFKTIKTLYANGSEVKAEELQKTFEKTVAHVDSTDRAYAQPSAKCTAAAKFLLDGLNQNPHFQKTLETAMEVRNSKQQGAPCLMLTTMQGLQGKIKCYVSLSGIQTASKPAQERRSAKQKSENHGQKLWDLINAHLQTHPSFTHGDEEIPLDLLEKYNQLQLDPLMTLVLKELGLGGPELTFQPCAEKKLISYIIKFMMTYPEDSKIEGSCTYSLQFHNSEQDRNLSLKNGDLLLSDNTTYLKFLDLCDSCLANKPAALTLWKLAQKVGRQYCQTFGETHSPSTTELSTRPKLTLYYPPVAAQNRWERPPVLFQPPDNTVRPAVAAAAASERSLNFNKNGDGK